VKGLLRFGLPMVPNGLAYLIVEISDRYLMPRLLNKEILGEYTANYKLGTVLLLLVIAFRTAWQPFFLKIAKQADAKEIYSRVMTYYIFIAAFVVLAVTMTIEYIVKIPIAPGMTLLGESYWGGVKIIPIILFSYMMFGVYVNLTVGIYIEKKSEWMIIFTGLAALINVSSNFYLMPAYGMMGAALATLLAYFVMMVSIYIANQRLYHISYEYDRILWIISYLTIALILYYYLDLNIIIRLLLIIGLPVLLSLLGFFKEFTYPFGTHTHIDMHKRSTTLIKERHPRFTCYSFRNKGFPYTRRSDQQSPFRKTDIQITILLWFSKKIDDLFKFLFDIFNTCNIGKGHT